MTQRDFKIGICMNLPEMVGIPETDHLEWIKRELIGTALLAAEDLLAAVQAKTAQLANPDLDYQNNIATEVAILRYAQNTAQWSAGAEPDHYKLDLFMQAHHMTADTAQPQRVAEQIDMLLVSNLRVCAHLRNYSQSSYPAAEHDFELFAALQEELDLDNRRDDSLEFIETENEYRFSVQAEQTPEERMAEFLRNQDGAVLVPMV